MKYGIAAIILVVMLLAWFLLRSPHTTVEPGPAKPVMPGVVRPAASEPFKVQAQTPEKKTARTYRSVDVTSVPESGLMDLVRDPTCSPTTRNDAANRLLDRRDPKLADDLHSMLRDTKEDLTWRNYCIQLLRGCYEQQARSGKGGIPEQGQPGQQAILSALLQACDFPEPELSSCALWSLAQLVSPDPWANTMPAASGMNGSLLPADAESRVKELALRALRDPNAHLLVRTGGVQSCARMGLVEAASDLRQIAGDAKAEVSLRTVAVAGLGQLKDQSARSLLTTLAADTSPRLSQAAQMALKALSKN